MSNKNTPHLIILPEDDAYISLALGFQLHHDINSRAIQIERPVGGWLKVIDCFKDEHIIGINKFQKRHLLLLIDCDKEPNRLNDIRQKNIPANLLDRVFVLGAIPESENLKSNVKGGFEAIGLKLANDCVNNTNYAWGHATLIHNQAELSRMKAIVGPFLFK